MNYDLFIQFRMRRCIFCGHTFDEHIEVFRSTLCPDCGKEAKICLHCKFYSPGAHWDCRETIPESVKEKDRANFCSYFSYKKTKNTQKEEKTPGKQEEAKDAFKKLFGN